MLEGESETRVNEWRRGEKKKKIEREREGGRKGALYAFLSARRFVCNNLCEKTAWEMTASSLCNLNLQQFTSGSFWEMAGGKIRGHGPWSYVCSSHEKAFIGAPPVTWSIKKKGEKKKFPPFWKLTRLVLMTINQDSVNRYILAHFTRNIISTYIRIEKKKWWRKKRTRKEAKNTIKVDANKECRYSGPCEWIVHLNLPVSLIRRWCKFLAKTTSVKNWFSV